MERGGNSARAPGAGYRGQASILRDYIRPKRPLRQARATVRFETAPGEQLQNDWAKYRTLMAGRAQEVHFAVNTLGYSRASFRGDGLRGRRTHLRKPDPEFRVLWRGDGRSPGR